MCQAIDSALAQTYKNVEVIVVNDGSTDDTDKIAKSYGNKIRYFKKKNGGVSSALNLGISKMKGEYFSWLSHDDIYRENKVGVEIEHLLNNGWHKKNVIVFSDYELISAGGKFISRILVSHDIATEKPEYTLLRGLINGNTLLIPKKAFDDFGGFDIDLKCTQDYEKWFELSKKYSFKHIPLVLVKSRYHAKQATHKNPLVVSEGNALWLKMIKSVKPARQIEMNGSQFAFYHFLIEYLKNTPYNEALEYCKEQKSKFPEVVVGEDDEYVTYVGSPEFGLSKNKIIRFLQLTRREGIKKSIVRVKKKLIAIKSKFCQ